MKSFEAFIGTWELIPKRSEYEVGEPAKSCTYQIFSPKPGQLQVNLEWIDGQGKEGQATYTLWPDGEKKTYENPKVGGFMRSEILDSGELINELIKADKVIAFGSRKVLSDGEMKIIQINTLPNGKKYKVIQYYKRIN